MAFDRLPSFLSGDSPRPEPGSRLTIDDAGTLINNERRRLVVDAIEKGDVVRLGDLARAIATAENEVDEKWLDASDRKAVYVALYQVHLPRLDEMDVVDFDSDRGTIRAGHCFDSAKAILDDVRGRCGTAGGEA